MNAVAFFDPLVNNGVSGVITFQHKKPSSGVCVSVALSGFRPNSKNAFHIHEYGDLTKGCMSTGKHFNPEHTTHGSVYTSTRHAGDLINNLDADQYGRVFVVFSDPLLSLFPQSSHCILGRAVVIHKYADDYGLGGHIITDGFLPYAKMPVSQLRILAQERGYFKNASRVSSDELVKKMEEQSLDTGNAGGRIACAVIGIAQAQ